MSDVEGQNELTTRKQTQANIDSFPSTSENGADDQTIFYWNEAPKSEWSLEDQHNERSTDVTNGKKRDDEKIVPMNDRLIEKDVPNNNENGVHSATAALNTAIIILPMTSSLFGIKWDSFENTPREKPRSNI